MNGHISDRTYFSVRDNQADIFELQKFLRYISRYIPQIPKVNPDGIYGAETENAVKAFQKFAGLPVSGNADYETRTQLAEVYDDLKRQNKMPQTVAVYPPEVPHLKEGDDFEEIYVLQIMLRRIARIFRNVTAPELSGVYDEKTREAVREFSALIGKEKTTVDRALWNDLTDTYNSFTYNS